jgi:hypothetical protein
MTRHYWSVTHASRLLVACLVMLPFSNQSSGKGGGMQSEDRYNPDHIESLPPEIRAAVIRQCGTPKALHTFVSYSENQRVTLHFEHFYCGANDAFCRPSGCLHQVYVTSHGRYRLLRSYYAPAGE